MIAFLGYKDSYAAIIAIQNLGILAGMNGDAKAHRENYQSDFKP